MSFLTAASDRSSSGLSGVSAAPSGLSPWAGALSSLAPFGGTLAAALAESTGAAFGSEMVSVFTGFTSVFAEAAFAGVSFAGALAWLLGATALAGAFVSW